MFLFADLSHKISRSFMNLGIISTASNTKLSTTQTSPISCPPWNYKKQISMNNPSSTLIDYQVNVTLDTASLISAGKMRSDCGDIRFIDSDGITPLNYWLESGCNSINTKLWVKVPSIPAGQKIIYLHYGNPSASSESNGTNTFLFFDDFSGSSLDTNMWSTAGASGTWSIDTGRLKGVTTSWNNPIKTKTFVLPNTYVFEGKMMVSVDGGIAILPRYVDSANFFYGNLQDYSGPTRRYLSVMEGSTWTTDTPAQVIWSYDAWYKFRFKEYPQYTYEWYTEKLDGTNIATVSAIDSVAYTGKLALGGQGIGSEIVYYDDIRVRKYTSPEPTPSVGTEELCTSTTTTASATTTNSITTTAITTTSTTTTINTEPPNIGSLSFNPKRIVTLNQIINISSNITDKFGSVFAWMNVTKPNGNYYYLRPVSLPGNIYRFDITETDVIGGYDFSIAAVNVNNNLTVKNDRFYVGNLYKFKLYFKDGDNERISVKYNLAIHPEGDNILSGEDRVVDRNIIEREYNLILKKNYVLLDLLLNISKDTSINVVIDELSQTVLDGISIPNSYKKLGYGINVSTDFMEGLVKLDYSDLDINEDNIRIYKCNRWNIEDRVCDGSWKEVTYNIDKNKGLVEIPVYSFSAFVLAEYYPPPRTTRLTTTTMITTVTTTTTTVTTTTTTVTTKAKKMTTTTTVPEVEVLSTQNWYIIVLFIVLVVVFYFAWFRKYMVFKGLKKKWSRRY